MPRYSDKRIPKPTQDELWHEFCKLVATLRSGADVQRFFSDVFNRSERLMVARRLHIAALLEAGLTYRDIKNITGAGSVTIARVHRWLEFGRGGYRHILTKLVDREPHKLIRKYSSYYRKKRQTHGSNHRPKGI